jgi:hypothetical protein
MADIRQVVRSEYVETRQLKLLSQKSGLSKATLSLWIAGKYKGDAARIEKCLRRIIHPRLTRRDEIAATQIKAILNTCSHPQAVIKYVADTTIGQ